MKSRTLCCKKTVVFKDITRFAPLWAIYIIGGLLVLLTASAEEEYDEFAHFLSLTIGPFGVINMIYAGLCAQLLFGDLFNARLCNALHAMPMRRETWFCSHVTSGLLFSLVPHLVALPLLMIACGKLWYISLLWLLGMTLSFLFFFGLAVFSMFCTGNRFAMVAVYGILNFAPMIIFWFWDTLYAPLMYGVTVDITPFVSFCPVVQLSELVSVKDGFVLMEQVMVDDRYHQYEYVYQGMGGAWWYLAILAVIGLAFLAVSLLMYRRRALETAGDFIAVKPAKPVFCVVFSLCSGCIFALFGELIGVEAMETVFLIIGLAVGYFASQMMLERMVKVFTKKAFICLGIFALVMVASLVVVDLDPLGVVTWMPEKQDVAYAEFDQGSDISTYSAQYLYLEGTEAVETLLDVHEKLLNEQSDTGRTVVLRYYLNNGRTVTRSYRMSLYGSAYMAAEELYGNAKNLLGYQDWDAFVASVEEIAIHGSRLSELVGQKGIRELLEAIRTDADAGRFAMLSWGKEYEYICYVNIIIPGGQRSVEVFDNATNTVAWLKEYQYLWEDELIPE